MATKSAGKKETKMNSQRMIDAANEAQENYVREGLKRDYANSLSEMTMGELVAEMKRLAGEIRKGRKYEKRRYN